MQDNEIMNIWKSYDQQLEQVLTINQKLLEDVTKLKVKHVLTGASTTKKRILLLGIPYLLGLYFLVFLGIRTGGVFFTIGFGAIAAIMSIVVASYFYHLYLIGKINTSDNLLDVQENLSRLRISSFKMNRLALMQIPFWSICWISMDALKQSLMLYGLINLLVFLGLSYASYLLYKNLDVDKMDNKLNKLVFSGLEWEPITKAMHLLNQIEAYKTQ